MNIGGIVNTDFPKVAHFATSRCVPLNNFNRSNGENSHTAGNRIFLRFVIRYRKRPPRSRHEESLRDASLRLIRLAGRVRVFNPVFMIPQTSNVLAHRVDRVATRNHALSFSRFPLNRENLRCCRNGRRETIGNVTVRETR